jgi:hypothetical protein
MATIILEVQEQKLKFFKDLIKNFSFGKVKEEEIDGDTDDEIRANIRLGKKEMNLVEEGKMKATPFKEFLKELDGN